MRFGLFFFLLFTLSFFFYPRTAMAADFNIDYSSEYVFSATGEAKVINQITLTNQQSGSYASEYVFQTKDLNLTDLKAESNNQKLAVNIEQKDDIKTVKITLDNNKISGRDQKYNFTLSYKTVDLAKKHGQLWQINLPNPLTLLNSYQLKIAVPVEFGEPQLLSPAPNTLEQKDGQRLLFYLFNQPKSLTSPRLIFGGSGLFSFELTYHLFNPNWQSEIQTIAIPPNISGYQEIFIGGLAPKPLKIETDPDGNVLASFKVDYNEKKTIVLSGFAKVFPGPSAGSTQNSINPQPYLLPAKYWETNDEAIISLLATLTNNLNWLNLTNFQKTKIIYNYVVSFLTYDLQKTNPRLERFGAVKALLNKDRALCMEYTDLLITLLRASDIPARELDGFAAGGVSPSSPPPLDILHTWVEVFDNDRGWFMVDPTWESTTGEDFLNSWDFSHLAFVVKGLDSEKPLPAGLYKITGAEKGDVKVEFATELDDKSVPLAKWVDDYQEEKRQEENSGNLIGISLVFMVLAITSGLVVLTISRKRSV